MDHPLQYHIEKALLCLGFDLNDPNLIETPSRVAKTWLLEFKHPTIDEAKKILKAFPEEHKQMVLLLNHTVWSRCPHHLERVKMTVSMGYLQGEKKLVVGASKLPRVADYLGKGLILQEKYTDQLADILFTSLEAKGVGVHVRGTHHCMCARGVESDGYMVTTSLRGNFLDKDVKEEFLQVIYGR